MIAQTIDLGGAPQSVAVTRSGQVVVLDAGGTLRPQQDWTAWWSRQVVGWLPDLRRVVPHVPVVVRVPARVQVLDASD